MTLQSTPTWAVQKLCAHYGPRQVLFDINLKLGRSEVLCLMGHNGAGKSTLLKALYGLVPVTAEQFDYLGANILMSSSVSRLTKGLAYMPEGRGVFHTATVGENLNLGLAAANVPKAERAARIEEVLQPLPILQEFFSRPAGLLSGGQQQMLSLARVLILRPRCLLLDEPSIGLAPKLFQDLMAVVRTAQQKMDFSVLLVEQNVKEALAIADRVIVMKEGKLIFEGMPADLDSHEKLMKLY